MKLTAKQQRDMKTILIYLDTCVELKPVRKPRRRFADGATKKKGKR